MTSYSMMMLDAMTRYFMKERSRYFVTSPTGFYRDRATGQFDEGDFLNVVPTGGGGQQIRGEVHPINVVEPVLWIGESVTASS